MSGASTQESVGILEVSLGHFRLENAWGVFTFG